MAEYRYIGKYTKRLEANDIVTGKATFLDDFKVPQMIFGKALRSPYPHARITFIDTTEAKKLKGVHAVITHKEMPKGWELGWPVHKKLMDEIVFFAGDLVAIVAADTVEIAEEAVDLIKVEYEELPAIFDAAVALAEGAPQIYERFKNNLVDPGVPHFQPDGPHWQVMYGDVEKGFAEAAFVAEDLVEFNKMPAPLAPEPPGAIVRWEGGPDYTIWATSQSPYILKLFNSPRIPGSNLRVKTFNVGGSYGNKQTLSVTVLCAALLAKTTNRPVKFFLTKCEQLMAHEVRLGSKIKAKIGMDKEGVVCAVEGDWMVDTGALADSVQGQVGVGLGEAQLVMAKCRNWNLDSHIAVTNKCPAGIVRGYGGQELNSCLALLMARTMRAGGFDPIECYKKNYVSPGDRYIWRDGRWWQSRVPTKFPEAMQKAADKFGWKDKWKGWGVPTSVNGSKARGIGAAVIGNADIGEDNTEAYVRLISDIKGKGSTVVVQCDITESGMGQRSNVAKMVAEVLNVPIEKVKVTEPDSMNNPTNFGLCGSRGTITSGKACSLAAADAKKKVFELGALHFGVSEEQLEMKDFMVYVRDNPEKKIPIKKLGPKDLNITGYGRHIEQFDIPSCMIFIVEVEVDIDTGFTKIIKITGGTDIGQIIDSRAVLMQLQGGIGSACVDTALFEECIYDPNTGRPLTTNLIDYKWRPFNEFPLYEAVIMESQVDSFMFKALGIGEISGAAGASAVMMAISNAIGVEVAEYPATPAVVLKALKKA